MAALAAAGHHTVRVRHRPVVAIVPTGDEVRPFGTILAPGEVLDTNSLMLAGMAEEAGGEVLRLPIVADRPDQLAAAVAQAAERAHIVLVIAGSSAGRDDHTAAVVRSLGWIAVHGVAMRPGHPVLLGMLSGERPVPVVGVPGYPASAERAFACFVGPLLRRVLEMGESAREDGFAARLGCAVYSSEHLDEYVRIACIVDPRTGRKALVAIPLQRGAGALNAIVQTEAVLRIPVGASGFAAGTQVRAVPVAGAPFGAATTIISGLRSPATDTLLELRHHEVPRGAIQWTESGAGDASEALTTGLCHAASLALHPGADVDAAAAIAAIVARAGEVTVLEVARRGRTREVIVVLAPNVDSPPIVALRTILRSAAFGRQLRRCDGYTGRSAGRETWHRPDARRPE
jgi:putative molybdopterin biosynthesis protein